MDMLHQPYVPALARALGHFIWQGAILGLAAHLAIRAGRLGATARYAVGVVCLAAMAAMPIVTTIYLAHDAASTASATVAASGAGHAVTAGAVMSVNPPTDGSWSRWDAHAIIVVSWMAGVVLLSLRLLGGWVMTRRFVGGARGLAAPDVRALAHRVAERLALTRIVEVFESPTIAVPMMVGWIKPCVILPTAALAGLTPVQVEALLAHELAHVRRHDYLVNLLQSAVETLLFYHPAVWWISRDVREAREHCCDDLAVAVCDRVVYASALADLAALARMATGPRFALAATDGSLVGRVRRILSGRDDDRGAKPGWLPIALLALAVAGMAPSVVSSAPAAEMLRFHVQVTPPEPQSSEPAEPPTAVPAPVPTGTQAEPPKTGETAPRVDGARDQGPNREQIEKLRAMLAEIESELAQIQGPEPDRKLKAERDQIEATVDKLRAERALLERSREEATITEDQRREVEAKLAAAASIVSDDPDVSPKLKKEAEQRQRDQALDRADVLKAKLAEMDQVKAELALRAQSDEQQEKLAKSYAETLQLDAENLVARVRENGSTEFDSKRVLSLIGPALKAGPGEVSVVGDVSHPGPIKWEDGLTAAAAITRAGAPSADGVDVRMGRLSEMNLTWGADGPNSHLRIDVIDPSATLRAGDVIVVTATKRK
ncbi:MAG TPA: M56 family metallopeptidase [Vicinamibacterales bacterium]